MKVLVMNGSPKGEKSDTMRLTKSFLEGMQVDQYEVIDTMKQRVNPCLGCYACWWKTSGKCVQKDGMEQVLEKIQQADVVIWSFPLYCYGMPSNMKAYVDRLLPLSTPVQRTDESGNTYHPSRNQRHAKMVMISGCGFPNHEGNYDGIKFAFQKLFPGSEMITCVEAPLLNTEEAKPLADRYLEKVRVAGEEYAKEGRISDGMHRVLEQPMLDPQVYRDYCSNL